MLLLSVVDEVGEAVVVVVVAAVGALVVVVVPAVGALVVVVVVTPGAAVVALSTVLPMALLMVFRYANFSEWQMPLKSSVSMLQTITPASPLDMANSAFSARDSWLS